MHEKQTLAEYDGDDEYGSSGSDNLENFLIDLTKREREMNSFSMKS